MILIAFGTRPEYLKLKSTIINTPKNQRHVLFFKQHNSFQIDMPELIDEELPMTDVELSKRCHQMTIDCMNYTPSVKIDKIIVQGDTTTAFSFGLWAFYHKIPVYHLEAGLRTTYKWEPYPEEINRRMISQLATYHLCSSRNAVENLKKEGIVQNVHLVGQTGLDLLHGISITYEKLVIITMHRRENWDNIENWFVSLENCATQFVDYTFLFPVHWNPKIREIAHRVCKKVKIVDPMNHGEMIKNIAKCSLIITDSGGLQEEGSFLQKKIIVCRKETERPEVLGFYSTLCPEHHSLLNKVNECLHDPVPHDQIYPYGDGEAYKNVIDILYQ